MQDVLLKFSSWSNSQDQIDLVPKQDSMDTTNYATGKCTKLVSGKLTQAVNKFPAGTFVEVDVAISFSNSC